MISITCWNRTASRGEVVDAPDGDAVDVWPACHGVGKADLDHAIFQRHVDAQVRPVVPVERGAGVASRGKDKIGATPLTIRMTDKTDIG